MLLITDQLLQSAFALRKAEPWELLNDSNVLAVSLSSGVIAYCCVMGHAGSHHSLGIYEGADRFSTYLKTLELSKLSQFDSHQSVMTFDCINCDFMQAADLDNTKKQPVRDFAQRHNLSIPRKFGWPDVTRFSPGLVPWPLTSEHDVAVAIEAMDAATWLTGLLRADIALAEKIGLKLGDECDYPTFGGGKVVPLLVALGDGNYRIESTKLPPVKDIYYQPKPLEADVVKHLRSLKAVGDYQALYYHIPLPVNEGDVEVPFYQGLIILYDNDEGILEPAMQNDADPDGVLMSLAAVLLDYGSRPKSLTVGDKRTAVMLADFCSQCGIKLIVSAKQAEDVHQAAQLMIDMMKMM